MVERRSIQELVTLYELEPDLRDVFVEGSTDRAVLSWYLLARGLHDRAEIYDIDAVDVSAEVCATHHLSPSNRNELIALAAEIQEKNGHVLTRFRCWVDQDIEIVEWPWGHLVALIHTDCPMLECYACTPRTIFKVIGQYVATLNGAELLAEARPILHWLFCFRIVNQRSKWQMASVPVSRSYRLGRGDGVEFDEGDFLNRVFNKAARLGELGEFAAELAVVRTELGARTDLIHGKDLAELLAWRIREAASSARANEREIRRHLFTALEVAELVTQPAFRRLEEFLAA